MGRVEYLAMETSEETTANLINSDLNEFVAAAKKLVKDAGMLGGLGFGTSFLQWAASISAIYLLILDRTTWRTKMLTTLLVPYIFFTLPLVIFHFFSGDFGKWIALIAITIRLFCPQHFPDWLEIPAAFILLVVVAPSLIAGTLRESWVGAVICLVIACYLFHEHIKASGGFKNSFTQKNGISNTIGIVALLVYPVASDGTVKFIEKDSIDYAAVTVQLPGGERVPFLFTIKQLVASGKPESFGGDFLVPSYRGSSFLDPKGRGGSTGYDNAVTLPARGDEEELAKENNKNTAASIGKITLSVTKTNPESGEVIGVFESLQPSDTDLGAKTPKDVKILGIWYAQLEE